MLKIVSSVFIICLLCVTAQVGLKFGMNKVGKITRESFRDFRSLLTRCIFNPFLWFSMFLYFFVLVGWLVILSKVDLSLAFPLLSMNYVLITLSSWLILKEKLTPNRVFGALIICFGIIIIK